tara:strand:- start:7285 stop:7899 length:615 start_codon:yes stop_codon:yes gene_type:complete
MATTTIDTETELSAVNSILGAIGQSPQTTLNYSNPEVGFIYNILRDTNVDIQNEGWHFNTENHVSFSPDSNKKIVIPDNILRMDVTDGYKDYTMNVVKRSGYLYDKVDHTDEFDNDIVLDVVRLFTFTDLPSVFQRYIILKASGKAATQLVNNSQLVQLLASQELQARAACLEYECNQGNHSYLGIKEHSVYQTYQPYHALRRI